MSKVLVFSHANGFPAGTYRKLFEAWRAAGWQVLAIDRFGHDPAYPVSSNWRPSRDELIAFVERSAPSRPAAGGQQAEVAAQRMPHQMHRP